MTVKECATQVLGTKLNKSLIGFYTEDESGNPKPIYPDFADEIIETHGDLQVKDYKYVESKKVLVIELQ